MANTLFTIVSGLALISSMASSADAQLALPSGVEGTCDLAQLDARVKAMNKVCCLTKGKPGSRCGRGGKGARKCNVNCAVVLLPLLKDCRPVLDLLYDHLDKNRDGHAGVFTTAYRSCLAIPSSVALDDLTRLHKSNPGVCTDAVLNNVANTKVTFKCVDKNKKCKAGIASGFVRCPAGGQCDKTCNLCNKGGHRRLEKLDEGKTELIEEMSSQEKLEERLDEERRRRTQSALACDLQSFEPDVKHLNAVCCDDRGKCATGVPTSCDAKCAVTFVEFFNRCKKIMAARFSTKLMEGFTRLHDTCSKRLPTEALLEAVAKCRGGASWSSASGASSPSSPIGVKAVTNALTHV